MKRYAKSIRWRTSTGAIVSVDSGWKTTEALALLEAKRLARLHGWRPPRWWEFWRWGETTKTETDRL